MLPMPVKKVSTLTRKEYELLYNKYNEQNSMGKPTGQMQEVTQDLLDSYNQLFNWDYNEMCRFIENYGETYFQTYYAKYHALCDDYGTELVDLFADEFDVDSVEKFEDMYEGHFETGQDFAFYYVNEVDKTTKDIPNWVTIDYKDVWENKLSNDYFEIDCDGYEYTYGHIFKKEV